MGLIFVDSGVWIDNLRDRSTPQTEIIRRPASARQRLAIGDLVLAEVLQGTRNEAHIARVSSFFADFRPIRVCDHRVAVEAARNYQALRALGITPRKTIDTLIATRCIVDRIPLLYSDRDFDPFVEHLGLVSALDASGVN
jgi:hypothetical protein